MPSERSGSEAPACAGRRSKSLVPEILVLLLAIAVRAAVILRGHQLDIDEADTALKVAKPLGALLGDLARDGHPPLYFLILKGWTTLFGRTEAALRALSTVFSAGTIGLLMWVARGLVGRHAALLAGALFALSPVDVFHASEGRMYTLVPLLGLAAFAATARLARVERPRFRNVALLGGIFAVGLYTHNYGLFVPPAAVAALAAAAWRRAGGPRAAAKPIALALAATAAALLLYLPWLPILEGQRASRAHEWLAEFFDATPPILAIPRSVAALAAIGPYPPITPPLEGADPLRFVALPVGLALLAAGVARCVRRERVATRDRAAGLPDLPVFALLLLLLPWLVSVTVKVVYLVGRYDVIALPFVALLLAAGAEALARRHRALAIAVVILLAAPLPGLAALLAQRSGGDVVAEVAAIAARPETRAVIATQLSGSRLRYYLARAGRADVLVRSFPTSTDAHSGWLERPDPADPALAADAEALVSSLRAALVPGDLLWATLYDNDAAKPLLVHALARHFAADAAASRLDMGLIAVRRQ